jgi:hypothetical protein
MPANHPEREGGFMNRSAFLHSRDGFSVVMLWILLIIMILKGLMLDDNNPEMLALVLVGGLLCSIPTLMHYRKIRTSYIRYIAATLLSLMALYGLYLQFSLCNYLILYVNMVMLSLYSNYRLVIYNGLWLMAITILAYRIHRSETIFLQEEGIVPLLIAVALVTAALTIIARRAERMAQELAEHKRAALHTQIRTNAAVDDLQSTMDLLYNWSLELEHDIQETHRICNDITSTLECTNLSMDYTAETAASLEEGLLPSTDVEEHLYDPLLSNFGSFTDRGEGYAPPGRLNIHEMRERFLRITAKMLHLSEHTAINQQAIEDIKAGLSHQYIKLAELIQATNSAIRSSPASPESPKNESQKKPSVHKD